MNKQTRKFLYGLILMVICFLLGLIEFKTGDGNGWSLARFILYCIIFLSGLNEIRETTK